MTKFTTISGYSKRWNVTRENTNGPRWYSASPVRHASDKFQEVIFCKIYFFLIYGKTAAFWFIYAYPYSELKLCSIKNSYVGCEMRCDCKIVTFTNLFLKLKKIIHQIHKIVAYNQHIGIGWLIDSYVKVKHKSAVVAIDLLYKSSLKINVNSLILHIHWKNWKGVTIITWLLTNVKT